MADKRVVVITGGTSGIGRPTALRVAVGGDHVVVAGILQNLGRLSTFDMAEQDRIWAVNYCGTYLCRRAFRRRMAAAGRGAIVNISSIASDRAFPVLVYGPAKTAINQLAAILAADLGPKGVRVNAVNPGYVLTDQMQARIDAGKRDRTMMQEQSALRHTVRPTEIGEGIHSFALRGSGSDHRNLPAH